MGENIIRVYSQEGSCVMKQSRFRFVSHSPLKTKIVCWILVATVVPLLVAGYLSYSTVEKQADRSARREMITLANSASTAATKFVENRCSDVVILSEFRFVTDALKSSELRQEASDSLKKMVDLSALYSGIALVDAQTGRCIAGSREELVGMDYSQDQAFAKAKMGQLDVTDLQNHKMFEQWYKDSGGWCVCIAVPVRVQSQVSGVLLAFLRWNAIENLVLTTKIGRTGYVFVLDRLDRMIVHPNRGFYGMPVSDPALRVPEVEEALRKKDPSIVYTFGNESTAKPELKIAGLNYPEPIKNQKNLQWKIGATAPASEMVLLSNILGTLGSIAVVVVVIVLAVSWTLAGKICRPITEIADIARKVADHDLTVDAPVIAQSDEIGDLSRAFRSLLDSLKLQIQQRRHGLAVLMTAVQQISSSVSEVSASASQIAGSVSETATTMEQLRRSAKISGDKAKSLSQTARNALGVSIEGKQAPEGTVQGIRSIRDQVDRVGETVGKLDDQSESIEQIISTVRDLADQSNLLAVNASIEAARAGESGKGFSVVAHEIKSLADQSRQSTFQIGDILNSIRNSVSAVVASMRQVDEALESGIAQSAKTQGSIAVLNQSVETSSQEASFIETSSSQQNVGMDQVSEAMTSIEQAMNQNLGAVHGLEEAANKLVELHEQLAKSVEAYRA
jgi:methyl-accepting chemotaxis protein